MKPTLNILILVSLFCSCSQTKSKQDEKKDTIKYDSSQSELKNDFREVRWGMTYEQVALTEVMLEPSKFNSNDDRIVYKTKIFEFGDTCYLQYRFSENRLYYIELDYPSADEFDNKIVEDGESFYNAFSRCRPIMKSIQTNFQYTECFVVGGTGKGISCPLPVTETNIYNVQNKLSALITAPLSNPKSYIYGGFIIQFDNDRSVARLAFNKRRGHLYRNNNRTYEWLMVKLEISEKKY